MSRKNVLIVLADLGVKAKEEWNLDERMVGLK